MSGLDSFVRKKHHTDVILLKLKHIHDIVTAVQSTSLLTEIYYGYGKGSVYLFVTIIVASVYLTTHEGPVVE